MTQKFKHKWNKLKIPKKCKLRHLTRKKNLNPYGQSRRPPQQTHCRCRIVAPPQTCNIFFFWHAAPPPTPPSQRYFGAATTIFSKHSRCAVDFFIFYFRPNSIFPTFSTYCNLFQLISTYSTYFDLFPLIVIYSTYFYLYLNVIVLESQ